ncbi:uncharacterized protein LOC126985972 [Eriocheir sinensis]|uniref:uncharacterized protein LOC126985972 n=1 Tax=Eriocheir sinensis TaxID=95602 RepID=UPI0021C7BB01|nr:uncharacterized protein LOC126985972 [Eriocheir sinensis]
MVGRGWWVLAWTVCAGWTVCVVCAGLTCQLGQEFFSDRQGHCVPCTRCHDPQVVVVPCYVYQDTVCAPAAQFIPNWSQPGRPQLPITLSTSPAPHTKDARTHTRHKSGTPSEAEGEEPKKAKGTGHAKPHGSKSGIRKHSVGAEGSVSLSAQNDSEKSSKEHSRHSHRHRHLGPQTQPGMSGAEESEANSEGVHEHSGASSGLEEEASGGRNSSGMESASRDIGDGANTSDKVEESDSEQPEGVGWKETFLFAAIIVISICLVVLTVVTLSHLRNILARRKLKRVYDGIPSEGSREARVMEQLLPSSLDGAPVVASRGTVTYIRATTAASSTPSSPAITTTASMSVEAQRTSGHVMDRLLEQRRVLGPASSVDTNLYIESWQQQDTQPAGHTGLIMQNHCSPLRGTVSACPSPAPVRTYRPGPASASASPTVSVRGLNITRGHVQRGLAPLTCAVLESGHGGCS